MYLLKLSARFFTTVLMLMPGVLIPLQDVLANSCSDTSCKVNVTFKGRYLEDTCEVVINNSSSNETVTLPRLSTAVLQSAGSEAGSVAFTITLQGCPSSKTVSLWFSGAGGNSDQVTGNLVNTSNSQNVQIRIRNGNGVQMVIDDTTSVQDYVVPFTGGAITHDYLASYYAKSAATAGLVETTAGVNLIYR